MGRTNCSLSFLAAFVLNTVRLLLDDPLTHSGYSGMHAPPSRCSNLQEHLWRCAAWLVSMRDRPSPPYRLNSRGAAPVCDEWALPARSIAPGLAPKARFPKRRACLKMSGRSGPHTVRGGGQLKNIRCPEQKK